MIQYGLLIVLAGLGEGFSVAHGTTAEGVWRQVMANVKIQCSVYKGITTMAYWLMKSEPDTFSLDDLRSRPDSTEHWDGVRNYQARNMMRDQMKRGDKVFFYHSSCPVPGIAGIAKVVREAYPDGSAQNPESRYYDPKASAENPRWFMVDVKFERKFKRLLPLSELKAEPALAEMTLLKKGNRLSIMPVSEDEWQQILSMV